MRSAIFFIVGWLWLYAQEITVAIAPEVAQKHKIPLKVRKGTLTTLRSYEHHPDPNVVDYRFSLQRIDHPVDPALAAVKAHYTALKKQAKAEGGLSEILQKTAQIQPVIGASFAGNQFDGSTPPDNTIAISNGGIIVTVVNSNIAYYNTSGTQLYSSSLAAFYNNNYTAFLYDPLVLYDPQIDRFIMVVLHGSDPQTSKVLLNISKTNDPTQGWWVYEISGDPAGLGRWFDYPKLGVSTDDIFITGNLYNANNQFQEVIIFQISKNSVINGGNIQGVYFTQLQNSPFTLLPLTGANGNYGPPYYLVSVNPQTDAIYVYEVTDRATGNPVINAYTISNVSINIAIGGDAVQKGTNVVLDVGDTRVLSGFYHNGIAHFVHNNIFDPQIGYNGVAYHRVTISTLQASSAVYGDANVDFAYPAIAWMGTNPNDQTVAINILASDAQSYPSHLVMIVETNMNNAIWTLVKAGERFVDYLAAQSNGVTRWGDYTGITRKYNASVPEVWVAGQYGASVGQYNAFNTWIAQIFRSDLASTATAQPATVIHLYPNPVPQWFTLSFSLNEPQWITIAVQDVQGREVALLLQDRLHQGTHQLRFDLNALAKGTYVLTIQNHEGKIVAYKTFIVD